MNLQLAHFRSAPAEPADPNGDVEIVVVVPVFKHSVFLVDAVMSALGQTFERPYRIVIVNDGCAHAETHRVALTLASSYPDRIDYIRKVNGGLSAARNSGVQYAFRRWPSVRAFYFLDADNFIEPATLARAYQALMSDPCAGWVYPDIILFGASEKYWDYSGSYSVLQHLKVNVSEAGSLVRSDVFKQGCAFDEDMKLGFEDWEFWWQAIKAGFVGRSIPHFGFRYRRRPESMLTESERDGSVVSAYMRRKHRSLFRAKHLLQLERREAPRYAVLRSSEAADIGIGPRDVTATISVGELVDQTVGGILHPHLHIAPRLIVCASEAAIALLRDIRLDRWAFWWLENELARTGINVTGMQILPGKTGSGITIRRMPHESWGTRSGAMHLLVWSERTIADCARDPRQDWINSLLSGEPAPRTAILQIEVEPELLGGRRFPEMLYRYFEFFKQVHDAVACSPVLPPVKDRWLPACSFTGQIPSDLLECGPLLPLLEDDGRDIAFVLPVLSHGGVEKVCLRMAEQFKRRGFRCHLLILSEHAQLRDEWFAAFTGVSLLHDPTFDIWGNAQSSEPQYLGSATTRWTIAGDSKPLEGLLLAMDAVIGFQAEPLNKILAKLRRHGVATASSLHVIDRSVCDRESGHPFLSLGYEHVYDLIATCSTTLFDWLHGMGVPRDKLVEIPNAPGCEFGAEIREEILAKRRERNTESRDLNVLFLGRLDRQKGLDRLAAIVARCRELQLPVKWRLVGAPVVEGETETEALASLGDLIEPPVHDPSKLLALYAWSDVLLLTSHWEGLPLTTLEAAQLGVVTLASRVGAIEEVIEDRINGMLLDNLPCAEFAELAIRRLIELAEDRGLLAQLSEQAASDMTRSWNSACDEFIARLDAIIAGNRHAMRRSNAAAAG